MLLQRLVIVAAAAAATKAAVGSAENGTQPRLVYGGTGYQDAILQLIADFNHTAALALHGNQTNSTLHNRRWRPRAFDCPPLAPSPARPDSVHQLRPGDFAVVGALGDSVTAGFGARATSLIDLAVEARGASWSIGGDGGLPTLPNYLLLYNPDLSGFSLGQGNAGRGYGDASISGAVAPGMLGQARNLVDSIRDALSSEAFLSDWKFVTLWIGGNDMCSRATSSTEFGDSIESALDFLQENLPRTFVNLVTAVDVGKLYDIESLDLGCLAVRPVVCSRGSDRERSRMEAEGYQRAIDAVVAKEKYDSDTFEVVVQPWYIDFAVRPPIDRSYLAPDCFHYSLPAMEFAARATWNNLFQPIGAKSTDYIVDQPIACPTDESPFLYTRRNSRQTK